MCTLPRRHRDKTKCVLFARKKLTVFFSQLLPAALKMHIFPNFEISWHPSWAILGRRSGFFCTPQVVAQNAPNAEFFLGKKTDFALECLQDPTILTCSVGAY